MASASPLPPRDPGLTRARFRELEALLRARSYGGLIDWSETVQPPRDCRSFAKEAIYAICTVGLRISVGNRIYWRCIRALARHRSTATVYRYAAKTRAIDHIWCNRKVLFDAYRVALDQLAYCATLPFIGRAGKYQLAKNLGLDVITPGVDLRRLAAAERVSVPALCRRLAAQTGYRLSTVDLILRRACVDGHLDSAEYQAGGWVAGRAAARVLP